MPTPSGRGNVYQNWYNYYAAMGATPAQAASGAKQAVSGAHPQGPPGAYQGAQGLPPGMPAEMAAKIAEYDPEIKRAAEEAARKAAEEAARQAEQARQAAAAKKAEQARQAAEAARKAEQARKASEQAMKAEMLRQAAEQTKKVFQAKLQAEQATEATKKSRQAQAQAQAVEEAAKKEDKQIPETRHIKKEERGFVVGEGWKVHTRDANGRPDTYVDKEGTIHYTPYSPMWAQGYREGGKIDEQKKGIVYKSGETVVGEYRGGGTGELPLVSIKTVDGIKHITPAEAQALSNLEGEEQFVEMQNLGLIDKDAKYSGITEEQYREKQIDIIKAQRTLSKYIDKDTGLVNVLDAVSSDDKNIRQALFDIGISGKEYTEYKRDIKDLENMEVSFRQELREADPYLYEVYVSQGPEAMEEAVAKREADFAELDRIFREKNVQLPDGQWMDKIKLNAIKQDRPEAYNLLVTEGFGEFEKQHAAAVDSLKQYEDKNGDIFLPQAMYYLSKEERKALYLVFPEKDIEAAESQVGQARSARDILLEKGREILEEGKPQSWGEALGLQGTELKAFIKGVPIAMPAIERDIQSARNALHEGVKNLPSAVKYPAEFIARIVAGGIIMAPLYTANMVLTAAGIPYSKDKLGYVKQVGSGMFNYFKSIPGMVKSDPAMAGELFGVFILGPGGVLKLAKGAISRVSPYYIPNQAMRFSFSVGKQSVKTGQIAAMIKAGKTTEVYVANAIARAENRALKNPAGIAKARIKGTGIDIVIEPTPVSKRLGGILWHGTPRKDPFVKPSFRVTGTGSEPFMCTSIHAAPRFAMMSARGVEATSPILVMIYTKKGGITWYPGNIAGASNLSKMKQAGLEYLGSYKAKPGAYGPLKTYIARFENEALLPNGMKIYRIKNFRSRVLGAGAGEFVTVIDGWVVPVMRFAEKGAKVPKASIATLAAIRLEAVFHGLRLLLRTEKGKSKAGFRTMASEAGYASVRTMSKQLELIGMAAARTRVPLAYAKAIDREMAKRLNDLLSRYPMAESQYRMNPERYEKAYRSRVEYHLARVSDRRVTLRPANYARTYEDINRVLTERGEQRPAPELRTTPRPVPEPREPIRPAPEPRETTRPRPAPEPRETTRPVPELRETIRPVPEPRATTRPVPEPRETTRPVPEPRTMPRPVPGPETTTKKEDGRKNQDWTPTEVKSAVAWRDGIVVHAIKSPYRRGIDEKTYYMGAAWTEGDIRSAIAWKQNASTIIAIKKPFNSPDDIATFSVNDPPPSLKVLTPYKGVGSAAESIRQIIGKSTDKVSLDMGIMDVDIIGVKGSKPKIYFTPDPEQSTQGELIVKDTGKDGNVFFSKLPADKDFKRVKGGIGNVPGNLQILKDYSGPGSQNKSVKVTGAFPAELTVDVGNQDVIITKEGNYVRLRHRRDTTGTISDTTIKRTRAIKPRLNNSVSLSSDLVVTKNKRYNLRPRFTPSTRVPGVISASSFRGRRTFRKGKRGRVIK